MTQEITPMEKAMRAAVATEVEQLRKKHASEEQIKKFIEDREKYIQLTLEHTRKPKHRDPLKPLASETFAKKFRRPGHP